MIAKSLLRCARKLTTLSISESSAPAVEAITGKLAATASSSKGQSVKEQLAIFNISNFCSTIVATEALSKGVAIAKNPSSLILETS